LTDAGELFGDGDKLQAGIIDLAETSPELFPGLITVNLFTSPSPTPTPTKISTVITGTPTASPTTPSPTVDTKPIVLKLSVSFGDDPGPLADMCSAMVGDVAEEAGIGEEDVTCKMTAYNAATFDYDVVLTLTVPEANEGAFLEVAEALTASIELLPDLEGANVALLSITDGEKGAVYIDIRMSGSTKAAPLFLLFFVLAFMIV
jgi:hypothetical protein